MNPGFLSKVPPLRKSIFYILHPNLEPQPKFPVNAVTFIDDEAQNLKPICEYRFSSQSHHWENLFLHSKAISKNYGKKKNSGYPLVSEFPETQKPQKYTIQRI